ncbi:MAG: hypothetical protein FWE50_01255 [Alphaproteobacteria bacterium]|nr:hypothetical protein [Alphaproteobacteria bacterium]
MKNRNLVNNVKSFVLLTLIDAAALVPVILFPCNGAISKGALIALCIGTPLVSGAMTQGLISIGGLTDTVASGFDAVFINPVKKLANKIYSGKPR